MNTIETSKYFTYNKDAYNSINYNIVSIVDKANPNNQISASGLGLQISKEDNYNAKITSTSPMPTNALAGATGQSYVLTIQAEGIRNGAAISRVDNTVNIVVQQSAQGADQWQTNNGTSQLTAYVDTTLTQPVKNYIDNKSGITDDSYKSTGTGMPNWLTIDKNGNFTGTPKSSDVGLTDFTVSAISYATGSNCDHR